VEIGGKVIANNSSVGEAFSGDSERHVDEILREIREELKSKTYDNSIIVSVPDMLKVLKFINDLEDRYF
jgi:ribosomal silencing factor RsfS